MVINQLYRTTTAIVRSMPSAFTSAAAGEQHLSTSKIKLGGAYENSY
jgi:hypothetical protein